MSPQHQSIHIHLAQNSALTLLNAEGNSKLTITPAEAANTADTKIEQPTVAPWFPILNSAELPRRFLDAAGNQVEAGSTAHAMTHFNTAGLIFDARTWRRVKNLKEAQQVAAECDLLGRKGDWVIGQDYETQLIIDRGFHAPAINKQSFPSAPSEGLVYTSRVASWSSVLVWFVDLGYGSVYWDDDGDGGLAVPVLRVPASQ